jgi:CcmD family protein
MPPQNLVYLFVAYSIIMVVLIGYMLFLSQQIGDLRNQLSALRRELAPRLKRREPESG